MEKYLEFACKLKIPEGPGGECSRGCCTVVKHLNREIKMAGERRILEASILFLKEDALAATFQCYVSVFVFFIDAKLPLKAVNCSGNSAVQCRCCTTLIKFK